MWTGAILAGGHARRLGGLNKAGLVLHPSGASILDRQLSRLSRVVDQTIIIANDAEPFTSAGVPVIADVVDGGALGGLYTAVHSAQTDRTLVVACDMPFLSEALLAHLVEVGRTVDIAIPRTARGYEPLCATYSRRSAPELRRLIDSQQLRLSDVASSDAWSSVLRRSRGSKGSFSSPRSCGLENRRQHRYGVAAPRPEAPQEA